MTGRPFTRDSVARTPVATWERGAEDPWTMSRVEVGELPDGSWYVDVQPFTAAERPRAFPDKRAAWAAVKQLMELRPGEWVRTA